MKDKDVVLGIVGAGYSATNIHLPVLTRLRNVRLAAICDIQERRSQGAARRYGIPGVYTNLANMLEEEDLDAVDILTPPDTHTDLAIQALRSNCHCLLEKPLSLSVADADKLIKVVEERRVALHVLHNYSFLPCMRRVRGLISSGAIGEVVGVDVKYATPIKMERYFDLSHWIHRLPGGVFSDIAPHLAMLILDFLGEIDHVKVMSRKTSNYPHIPADELKVMVDGRSGLGSFTLCFNTSALRFVIDILGTKRSLYIDADTNTVVTYGVIRKPSNLLARTAKGVRALGEIYQRLVALSSNAGHTILCGGAIAESHAYLINSFLHSIQGKGAYPISIERCREAVSLLEKVYSSIPK